MIQALQVLQVVIAVGYSLLAVRTAVAWMRQPDRRHASLALAMGSLAFLILIAPALGGSGFEGVKDRMMAFKNEFKRKLFLDKIIKGKEKEDGTNGMGEVQYITYPNGKELEGAMDDLDRIERQVAESAKNFERKQSFSGGIGELGEEPIL